MDPYKFRPSSSFDSPFWTTNSGAPVWNNNSSLTVGARASIAGEVLQLVLYDLGRASPMSKHKQKQQIREMIKSRG
ncbi:hypothetical protein GOBAR_DD26982 [Gossypium barbadense]|nr:hypothetical protein GOBAR_DD26982 [Gossypium barbadense]